MLTDRVPLVVTTRPSVALPNYDIDSGTFVINKEREKEREREKEKEKERERGKCKE